MNDEKINSFRGFGGKRRNSEPSESGQRRQEKRSLDLVYLDECPHREPTQAHLERKTLATGRKAISSV